MTTQTYTTAGSSTFTVPAGVTSIVAKTWGAGGGGLVGPHSTAGQGGGGGAYSVATVSVTPAQQITVTVGAAGAGGSGVGGDSSFIDDITAPMAPVTYCLAKGGNSASAGTGGAAASGTGDTKTSGSNGASPSGSTGGAGGNAGDTGTGGAGGTAGNNGSAGVAPGGGGGGVGDGGANGGAGAVGRVQLEYTEPAGTALQKRQVPVSSPYFVNWQSPVNRTAGLNAGLRLWYLAAPIFAWSGTGADGVLNSLVRGYQATAETGMQVIANGGAGASFLPRPGGWGCFKFSAGADQQIAIPGNLFASNAAGTIAMWVMWDNSAQDQGFGSRYGYCTGKTNASSTYNNYILALTTNDADTAKLSWYPYSGSATATCTTTTTPGRWVWNHVCVTFKSGAHTIHVNGVQEDSGTTAGTMNSGTDNFLIGGLENSANPSYLSGAVDDFRFYDRILSDTEVSQLYRESKSYYPTLLRRWRRTIELPAASTFKPAWAARCNRYSTAGILT